MPILDRQDMLERRGEPHEAKILVAAGRAMKELEREQVVVKLPQLGPIAGKGRRGDALGDDGAQFAFQERGGKGSGDGRKRGLLVHIHDPGAEILLARGNIEPAVRGHAVENGIVKAY
jgi:hypothetical protein